MTTWTDTLSPDSAAIPRLAPDRVVDIARARRRHEAVATTRGDETTTTPPLDDVVRAHLPGLLRYATVLTGDPHTAADLVQEVLLRAHQRWTRISLMGRPDLYLRRMVTNEHLSWRRRWHERTIRPTEDDVLAAHATPQRDHAHRVVEDDDMWQRLATLPPRQRTVLVLRYYEGLDDVEIATVMDTTSATVRSHASRALATLRRATTSRENS